MKLNLVSVIASALCAGVPSLPAQTVRDSAGIRVVDNARPAWTAGREWRVADKPVVDIGGRGGPDYELGRIAGVVRLSDGRIVVADPSTLQLRFYDAAGRHLKAIGGRGGGPGEFRDFNGIARLAGDTIAVEMMRGSTIFSPAGVYVRTVQYGPFPQGVMQTPFVSALGHFDNGSAVVMDYPQGERGPAGAARWIDSSSLFLVGPTGTVIRPLGKAPVAMFVRGTTHPSPLDFGPDAPHASPGRALYLGFTNQYAIRVYSADWKLERIVRRAWTPKKLSGPELDSYVDGWMALWSKATGAQREVERREMRAQPYPELLPAYSAILVNRAGEMFVREPDLGGAPGCWCLAGISKSPSRWSVFDSTGRWLGDMTMPASFQPLEVGDDYVLGKLRDADDVPHAVMYRLVKPK